MARATTTKAPAPAAKPAKGAKVKVVEEVKRPVRGKKAEAPAPEPKGKKVKPAVAQPDPNVETQEVKLPPGFKLPKTLAACADLLYELQEERKTIEKSAKALEDKEKALRAHLINTLPKSYATGVSGKKANVRIVTEDVPQVKDWPKFYEFIKKNNAFELLNKALNKAAVKERMEAKKAVPGVGTFRAVKVSLTKAK
jgi:hypothetical protein